MPEDLKDKTDHTSCGCKKNDPRCYCDEDGVKQFRPIPSNG